MSIVVVAVVATVGVCGLISAVAQRASYHSGFHDGALWAHEGESYPSKPHDGWWGWKPLRNRMGRKTT